MGLNCFESTCVFAPPPLTYRDTNDFMHSCAKSSGHKFLWCCYKTPVL